MSFIRLLMVFWAVAGAVLVLLFDPRTEALVLMAAMTVLALAFSIKYAWRSPWRSTAGGKALMFTTVSLGLLGAQIWTVWAFGDYPGRNEIRSLLMLALVMSLLYRYLLLGRYQRRDRARAEALVAEEERLGSEHPSESSSSYVPLDKELPDER